jgi:hypothetical protein
MTQDGPVLGKILNQNAESVTVQPPLDTAKRLSREKILMIYSDEGDVLWKNPQIVESDSGKPDAVSASVKTTPLSRWNIELHSGFGISSPSSIFSSFHVSSGPDYHYQYEIEASGVWSFTDSDAVVATLGYARRNLTAAGITLDGIRGDSTWPLQFFDTRLGYRMTGGIGFAEVGFLYASHLGAAQVEHVTTLATYTPATPQLSQKSYGAIYLTAGLSLPVNEKISLLAFARLDQGLGAAVRGEVSTQLTASGQTVSTATLSLVPWSVAFHLGVSYRL